MAILELYSATWCKDSTRWRDWLTEKRIPFVEYDIQTHPEYRKQLARKMPGGDCVVPALGYKDIAVCAYPDVGPLTETFMQTLIQNLTQGDLTMAASRVQCELWATIFEAARDHTLMVAREVPEEKRLFQLEPGKATPLWLVGHLANAAGTVILQLILGRDLPIPKEYRKKFAPDFAGGLPPTNRAEDYPPYDAVLTWYERIMSDIAEGIRGLDDSYLPQPVPERVPEPLRAFFSTYETTLLRLSQHDAYHRGQIGLLAKLNSERRT